MLQRLQNRAARIITGDYDYTHSVSDLIEKLGWDKLADRRKFHISTLMYKTINGQAPKYLQTKFNKTNTVHDINTRSYCSGDLYIPRPRIEKFRQSLAYKGAMTWNSLPRQTKQARSLAEFKTLYQLG